MEVRTARRLARAANDAAGRKPLAMKDLIPIEVVSVGATKLAPGGVCVPIVSDARQNIELRMTAACARDLATSVMRVTGAARPRPLAVPLAEGMTYAATGIEITGSADLSGPSVRLGLTSDGALPLAIALDKVLAAHLLSELQRLAEIQAE